jgi:hypothetical protein
VTNHPLRGPDEQPVTALLNDSGQVENLPDVAQVVREFNASNQAHEDLWTRVHQAGDIVRGSIMDVRLAREAAREAQDAHLAVQAEHPHRRAGLLQQLIFALLTIVLDGVTCWFAAQALGSGQLQTLLWTGLFLAVLASGEVALDFYSDSSRRAWRLVALGLAAFVAGLGVLRFTYLATVGSDGTLAALVGAVLFSAITSGFLLIGYRALRAAERYSAWKARRYARRASREAAAAANQAARHMNERNRLVDAYLSRIRVSLMRACAAGELPLLEAAVRAHLTGRDA